MTHKFNIAFFALGITAGVFLFDGWQSTLFLVIVSVISFIIMSVGVINIKWNYFFKSLCTWKNDKTLLTFDDGPDPDLTPKVLDILKENGVKAIFFLVGSKAEQQPELVKRIVQEGHIIGNHSYAHNNFMSLQMGSKVRADIEKCQQVLFTITGQNVKLFRPPVGYTNPIIGRVLAKMKLICVGWTIRSFDTVIKDEQQLINRLIKKNSPGAIVLLHDSLEITGKMLPAYIREGRRNGIVFVDSFSDKLS